MKKLLYFTAEWCGPCQKIKPTYKEQEKLYPDINFSMIDVDLNQAMASKYKITNMPTFIAIMDGQELQRISGADPNKLVQLVELLANK